LIFQQSTSRRAAEEAGTVFCEGKWVHFG
jgi:hypothetical protein